MADGVCLEHEVEGGSLCILLICRARSECDTCIRLSTYILREAERERTSRTCRSARVTVNASLGSSHIHAADTCAEVKEWMRVRISEPLSLMSAGKTVMVQYVHVHM